MTRYGLPRRGALGKIGSYFSLDRGFLEELYLSTTSEVVSEIPESAIEELEENVKLWREGYALPLEVLREARRIKENSSSIDMEDFEAILHGEELLAEPDSDYGKARNFCSQVTGRVVLDIASGFGWIPLLLSRGKRVFALDSSYLNQIIYGRERVYIEGTSIELFPDFPEGRALLREEKLERFADFAWLFWEQHEARLEDIVMLQGDASNLGEALALNGGKKINLNLT